MSYCLFVLSLLATAAVSTPTPQPSPVANPQVFLWPYPVGYSRIPSGYSGGYPLQYSMPQFSLAGPRSLLLPLAFVTSQDTSRGIPQPVDDTEEVKTAKIWHAITYENVKAAHERSKRETRSELGKKDAEGNLDSSSENTEEHQSAMTKRQAAYVSPVQMPYLFTLGPLTYSWATQSFVTPSGSSSWSLVAL